MKDSKEGEQAGGLALLHPHTRVPEYVCNEDGDDEEVVGSLRIG